MAEEFVRRFLSIRELSDEDLVLRYRRVFQTAKETVAGTPAWFDLELTATLIADELNTRAVHKPELGPGRLWQQWEAERGGDHWRSGDEPFTPAVLDRTVIALPLLREMDDKPEVRHDIIIDLNLEFAGGVLRARERLLDVARSLGIVLRPNDSARQFVFGRLTGDEIRRLVAADQAAPSRNERAIFHMWPDFPVRPLINKSITTVKADAARASFSAAGKDIVWAVVDSGIESGPHFDQYKNLTLPHGLEHRDFTGEGLGDGFGHGSHVAGIIGGARSVETGKPNPVAVSRVRDEHGKVDYVPIELKETISGMAPKCALLDLKVLDATGNGRSSSVIEALNAIQEINGNGRRILVHGVNLSVGYNFEPEWFACGQSPLCVEVDRLVKSGVAVVVAAGNTGYGTVKSTFRGAVAAGMLLTINDPGNAELAITVGATHRDMPHTYGVSYFSSKGPTGDGRLKPDLVAPGEKILSCAAGKLKADALRNANTAVCDYTEDSGTSMAAPHVSGVIAAFLSVRREFIGQPEMMKKILLDTATDLGRDRYFQGAGLVDLMRAIQSV